MPGSDCRLKLLLVVTVLCLYCMISTLISVTRHTPTSHPGRGQMFILSQCLRLCSRQSFKRRSTRMFVITEKSPNTMLNLRMTFV